MTTNLDFRKPLEDQLVNENLEEEIVAPKPKRKKRSKEEIEQEKVIAIVDHWGR